MGPRAFAHGDAEEALAHLDAAIASMGPRAFAHGDASADVGAQVTELRLQWGRGLSPTETRGSIK